MDDLSWYLGCAFEHDKMEGVMKKTQTAVVDSLVGRFDTLYDIQTPASAGCDLGPKRIYENEDSWWSVVDLGEDTTEYSECGEGSCPTCPQSSRAAVEGGSEDNCLPKSN